MYHCFLFLYVLLFLNNNTLFYSISFQNYNIHMFELIALYKAFSAVVILLQTCQRKSFLTFFCLWLSQVCWFLYTVQSRPSFCIIDTEYFILMQNEIIVEWYWWKKELTSYASTSKVAGNNKNKFWKIGELTSPKWVRKMTVISGFMRTSSFWVRHSTQFQERLEHTFQLSAYVALLINSNFIWWLFSFVFVSLWKDL